MKTRFLFALVALVLGSVSLSADPAAGGIGEADDSALLYMLEEEKLARDVYQTLAAETGLRVFSNIAEAEKQHLSLVAGLVIQRGIPLPETLSQPGIFTNADLQELYDELVARGRISDTEALAVGRLIEETDIADLNAYAAATDDLEIQALFTQLREGSERHLAAFSRTGGRR